MPGYLHPGVYIEETPSGSRPIEGVATSVAAFVGKTNRGKIGEPELIGHFDDFLSEFGPIENESDAMALAVQAYYLNGGGAALICRLASGETSSSSVPLDFTPTGSGVLTVTASSPGTWGDALYVRALNPTLLFDLEVGTDASSFSVQERFYGLSLDSIRGDYAATRVNAISTLVRIDSIVETLTLAEPAYYDQLEGQAIAA